MKTHFQGLSMVSSEKGVAMFKYRFSLHTVVVSVFFLALLGSFGRVQAQSKLEPAAPSLATIIEKHVAAIGHSQKIQSRRITVRMVGLAPFDIISVAEAKRPQHLRREVNIQGNLQVTAYDGQSAWKIDPFMPSGKKPVGVSKDDLPALIEESYFDGLLIAAKESNFAMRYVGIEKLANQLVHVIQIDAPVSGSSTLYLDATSFLEVKRLQRRMVMGKLTELEVYSSDYRSHEGVLMPFKFEIGLKGGKPTMQMLVEQITFNPKLDHSRFQTPTL
jgi:outer membrane lipoprotein-sorting protein